MIAVGHGSSCRARRCSASTSSGTTSLAKLRIVRVHDVERHLHGVEVEAVLLGHFEHVEMDVRIFVAGEADVADLAGLLALRGAPLGASSIEDAVRIVEADDLVVLDQVDVVGLRGASATRRAAWRPPSWSGRRSWSSGRPCRDSRPAGPCPCALRSRLRCSPRSCP